MKKKIYYIGFYGDEKSYQENRNIVPAGSNKLEYIAKAIAQAGFSVKVISPAWVKRVENQKIKLVNRRDFKINNNISVSMPFSIAGSSRIISFISSKISKIWLILYLLLKVRRNDKVIVYNSPFYFSTIFWLKKIIGFNLILEVEEVYSIVFSYSEKQLNKEMRLIKTADKYIFPNDLMSKHLNIKDKENIVVYGSYEIAKQNVNRSFFDDDKIHIVYAGIIDKIKKGAFYAIRSAAFLPDNYIMHLLGFGSASDINELKKEIEQINKTSKCQIIFEGKKIGQEYIDFMTSCDIGLSTQKNEGEYLLYTFPSKVLSYMGMGLRVVAARMDCLTMSSISPFIDYYDDDKPELIAKAILNIDNLNRESILSQMKKINSEFIKDLTILLGKNIK